MPERKTLLSMKPLAGEGTNSTARLIERMLKGVDGDLFDEQEKITKAKAKIKKIMKAKLIIKDILREAYEREGL